MVDLTVLEIHLDTPEFNAPFARTGGADRDAESAKVDVETESSSGPPGKAFGALVALAVLAGLAWYVKRGRSDDEAIASDPEGVASQV